MIKMILAFLFLFCAFFIGIKLVGKQSKMDKIELLKIAGYSTLCAALTLGVLVIIVLFF
jgi:hypothetical protein